MNEMMQKQEFVLDCLNFRILDLKINCLQKLRQKLASMTIYRYCRMGGEIKNSSLSF